MFEKRMLWLKEFHKTLHACARSNVGDILERLGRGVAMENEL